MVRPERDGHDSFIRGYPATQCNYAIPIGRQWPTLRI